MIDDKINGFTNRIYQDDLTEFEMDTYLKGLKILENYNRIKKLRRLELMPKGILKEKGILVANIMNCLQKNSAFDKTTSVKTDFKSAYDEMKKIDHLIFSKGLPYMRDVYGVVPLDIFINEIDECKPNIKDINFLIQTAEEEWPHILSSVYQLKKWKSYRILENQQGIEMLLDSIISDIKDEEFKGEYVPIAAKEDEIEFLVQIKNLDGVYVVTEENLYSIKSSNALST